ncbi:CLUMA_CG000925, isoform A [Clunio marinus]|uniref:CLUMA_CG000925, isoform A n=1 Tax=Clunio marinus TaxID=568069 RepID=A0A1J1HLA8_9DIPT|nr:CLUMA_CG000925, isoform A [Clunio marinus]
MLASLTTLEYKLKQFTFDAFLSFDTENERKILIELQDLLSLETQQQKARIKVEAVDLSIRRN